MALSRTRSVIKERRIELGHALVGGALGASFAMSGLLADMQVRAWRGFDGGVQATFGSSLMHSLALLSPFVLGRIFYGIGKTQKRQRERLFQAGQAEAMMRAQAHRDSVTGLYNRAYLTRTLEEGIATGEWAARGGLVYMVDLDDFKHVNDTFGHRAGDLVLMEVARRITACITGGDIAVRLGGDEFVVVHFPTGDETMPELFAEKLLKEINREVTLDETRTIVNSSIGIARVGIDGFTWSDVMRSADLALYQAKLNPQSSYRVFEADMKTKKDMQLALEAEIRLGIDRGEFELYYQPIYGTDSGAIRSFEALVRWNHPTRGLVPPIEFIPTAESSGLIVRLGRHILSQACRRAATWPKPVGICVNLSPVQFKDLAMVDHIEAALEETGLAPGRLDLEITESLLLESSPQVDEAMKRLRALGVRITMDDFGTGFSSLSNLRSFRFDRLKIDRSFTRDVESNPDDAEIVRTIVKLSRTLHMETILEGVENEGQLAFARTEGLTEVQGFYYAKPMTAACVDTLLSESRTPSAVAAA